MQHYRVTGVVVSLMDDHKDMPFLDEVSAVSAAAASATAQFLLGQDHRLEEIIVKNLSCSTVSASRHPHG